MDPIEGGGDNRGEAGGEKRDIRRPMNAFLIFCKRHRSMVREKHPDRDNRSVTRILGDLWANLAEDEKMVYTNLAKQYKDAFMKAHPDYKWHSSEKVSQPAKMATRPTNARPPRSLSTSDFPTEGGIMPGQLADPDKMGGLNLLLMAGQHSLPVRDRPATSSSIFERRMTSPDLTGANAALLQLAEMCSSELRSSQADDTALRVAPPKKRARHWSYSEFGHSSATDWEYRAATVPLNLQPLPNPSSNPGRASLPPPVHETSATHTSQSETSLVRQEGSLKQEPTNSNTSYPLPGEGESKQVSQEPSSLDPVVEEVKSERGIGEAELSATSRSDISVPPKKKLTKLQDVCKAEQETTPAASAENSGCLSDQNDNAIFACGKLVVNHIIDRLFSASFAPEQNSTANNLSAVDIEKARKILTADMTEREKALGPASQSMGKLLSEVVQKPQNLVEKVIEEAYTMDLKQFRKLGTTAAAASAEREVTMATDCTPGPDHGPGSEQSPAQAALKDWAPQVQTKDTLSVLSDSAAAVKEEAHEAMHDEDESFMQPVRKSQRRNRGQRYQELINEGIIQPSKERLAARRHEQTSSYPMSCHMGEDGGMEEDGERPRHSLKRSISESDSVNGDEKRYRTGDFDLEAEIATLPPCSLEQVTRRRPSRKRSDSESSRKQGCPTSPSADDISAVARSQQQSAALSNPEPLTGSQKRKARKHSISRLVASTDVDSGSHMKSPGIVTTVTLVRDATVTKGDTTPSPRESGKPAASPFFPSHSSSASAMIAASPVAMTMTLPSATVTTTSITTSIMSTLSAAAVTTTITKSHASSGVNSYGGTFSWPDTTLLITEAAQKIQQLAEEKGKEERHSGKTEAPLSKSSSRLGSESHSPSIPKMAVVSSEFTNLKELDDDTWIPCYIPKEKPAAGSSLYGKDSEKSTVGDSKFDRTSAGSALISIAAEKYASVAAAQCRKQDSGKGANSWSDSGVAGPDGECKNGESIRLPGSKSAERRTFEAGTHERPTAVGSSKAGSKSQQRRKPTQTASLLCKSSSSSDTQAAMVKKNSGHSTDYGASESLFRIATSEMCEGKTTVIMTSSQTAETTNSNKVCAIVQAEPPDSNRADTNGNSSGIEGYRSSAPGRNSSEETISPVISSKNSNTVPSPPAERVGETSSRGVPSTVSMSLAGHPAGIQKSDVKVAAVASSPNTTPSASYTSASCDFATLAVVSSTAMTSCVETSVSMTTTVTSPSLDLEMMDDTSAMETAVGGQMLCQSPIPGSPSVGVVHS